LVVEIREGEPSGTILASESVPYSQISTTASWIKVTFSSPPSLTKDNTYSIVLHSSGSSYYWYYYNGNHYDWGNDYSSSNSGSGWGSSNHDFTFRTYSEQLIEHDVLNLEARGGDKEIQLYWTNPHDASITKLNIYLSTEQSQLGDLIDSVSLDSRSYNFSTNQGYYYSDASLNNNQTYYITVKSADSSNNESQGATDNCNTISLTLDQQQTEDDNNYQSNHDQYWSAQTFIPQKSPIHRIDIDISRYSAIYSDLVLDIRETSSGQPTGTVVGTTKIAYSQINTSEGWIKILFKNGVSVTPGQKYAIVLHTSSGGGEYRWYYHSTDYYSSGQRCTSSNSGSSWSCYNPDLTFKVYVPKVPTVQTLDAQNITGTSAVIYGNILDTGDTSCSERGFDWGTTESYGNSWTESGTFSTGQFSLSLTGLSRSTTYHFRAKALNINGWGYGSDLTFTTEANVAPSPCASISTDKSVYKSGETVTFTCSEASDPDGDKLWLYICNSYNCLNCEPGNTSGCIAVSNDTQADFSNPTATYDSTTYCSPPCDPSVEGSCCEYKEYQYWAKVCDNYDGCSYIIGGE